jgi:serine/threonine protein kinase
MYSKNAKIADLGSSYLLNSNNIQKIDGTPLWLAPETIDLNVNFKSDVYSFGSLIL